MRITPPRPRLRRALIAVTALGLVASPAIPAAAADVPVLVSTENQSGSQISLKSTDLIDGDDVVVNWTTDAPHAKNWIGVYPKGVKPGGPASTQWDYTPQASGTITFSGLGVGQWDIYLLAQDGYGVLAGPLAATIDVDPDKPRPGDPDAAVNIDPVVTGNEIDEVVLREGFTADGADGWSVEFADAMVNTGSDAFRGWQFTTRADWTADIDEMRKRFGRSQQNIAVADAQQFGGSSFDATLASAPVDVTGLGAVRLTFDSHYRGAAGQSGVVEASFDGGAPVEVLRLDSETVTDGYDARQMNYSQDIAVDVPAGAKDVVFTWRLAAESDARYWAIDSVMVHEALAEAEGDPTRAWVMSDIQGHPQDLQHALGDYAEIAPGADAMMMVGDIVNSGTVREWQEIYDVMDATASIRPRQTIASIGNHERYAAGGFDSNRDRFLAFADRDSVWDEYVLEGPAGDMPVIVLGQEFGSPSDVAMSDAQVEFFEERLAYWTAQGKQVIVNTHFPLGETVSASWIPWYSTHHQMNNRLTSILGNYPNAIVFSGHTHYPAELGDWAMQRRTADGHPDGFWAVNTIAMHIEWDARGENTQGINEVTTRDINQGLVVDSYGDRVVVRAYDFFNDELLREVVIPNPLVASETVAGIVTGDPEIVSTHHLGIKPGKKVIVEEGEWSEGTEFSYQWLADGQPIKGQTGRGFHLLGKYKGMDITVAVTGTVEGLKPATVVSEPIRID